MRIAVLGAGGQLAQCIKQELSGHAFDHQWVFWTKEVLNITWNKKDIEIMLASNEIDLVINCAAYTDVNGADDRGRVIADSVNHLGVCKLAEVCTDNGIELIHISTDYVYDGLRPYGSKLVDEKQLEIPINHYGLSKLRGDDSIRMLVRDRGLNAIILRTSSLFYEFGKNFFTAVIDRNKWELELFGLNHQLCTPTYGRDLARRIIRIAIDHPMRIKMRPQIIYNISGDKVVTRYEQVCDIVSKLGSNAKVRKLFGQNLPGSVMRPNTPLDNTLINKILMDPISYESGLSECVERYKSHNNENILVTGGLG